MRPHEALKGKTPAEAAGIEIQGENKWLTLIQNARMKDAKCNVEELFNATASHCKRNGY
jgi:hypothetical protein